jgi:hypothetical protein
MATGTGEIDLVIAADAPTREAVYRFRAALSGTEAAVDLLPSGYQCANAAGLQDLLDPFAIVAAAVTRDAGDVIGCARMNFLRDGPIPFYPELYGLSELTSAAWMSSSITSGFALAPSWTCDQAHDPLHPAMRLAWTLYDIALRERICHDFLDCASRQLPFFERLGYRRVRDLEHPVRGRTHLLRLDIYDWPHLAGVDSPFLSLARGIA